MNYGMDKLQHSVTSFVTIVNVERHRPRINPPSRIFDLDWVRSRVNIFTYFELNRYILVLFVVKFDLNLCCATSRRNHPKDILLLYLR